MKWWLIAEPKDQDLPSGSQPVAQDGLPTTKTYKSYYGSFQCDSTKIKEGQTLTVGFMEFSALLWLTL